MDEIIKCQESSGLLDASGADNSKISFCLDSNLFFLRIKKKSNFIKNDGNFKRVLSLIFSISLSYHPL